MKRRSLAGFKAPIDTPGDFNRDAVVDAADYIVLRKGLGTTYTPDDYNVWRARFGEIAGSGAVVAASSSGRADSAIPEPGAWWLAMFGAVIIELPMRACRQYACQIRTLSVAPSHSLIRPGEVSPAAHESLG